MTADTPADTRVKSLKTTVRIGLSRIAIPDGFVGRLLTYPSDRKMVEAFLRASPDATLYHQPAWLDFARHLNRAADLLMIERDGAPQFALPIHPQGLYATASGYSGLLLPPFNGESGLRRSIRAFRSFVDANPGTTFGGVQSALSRGAADVERYALVGCLLEGERLAGAAPWSRLIDAGSLDPGRLGAGRLDDIDIDDDDTLLRSYDGKLRNQIRQARRNGVAVECAMAANPGEARPIYEEIADLHRESWTRTGLRPHSLQYWLQLNAAVVASGGHDLIAMARTPEGRLVAMATAHVFGDRAIYAAGASIPAGLELRANPTCLHEVIKACLAAGVTTFELGRFSPTEPSDKERSITQYKAQFGGHLVRLNSFAATGDWRSRLSHDAFRVGRRVRVKAGGDAYYP